jgi:SulP family sulfate permease
MVRVDKDSFTEVPLQDRTGDNKEVLFLQLEGQLFFGVADELEERLGRLTHAGARIFIFRLRRTHSIDSTVLGVLERFTRQVQQRGGHVILCGLRPELLQVLRAYGLYDLIGEGNVFETGGGIFNSARRALNRASQLVGHSIDAKGLDDDPEPEALMYEI